MVIIVGQGFKMPFVCFALLQWQESTSGRIIKQMFCQKIITKMYSYTSFCFALHSETILLYYMTVVLFYLIFSFQLIIGKNLTRGPQ